MKRTLMIVVAAGTLLAMTAAPSPGVAGSILPGIQSAHRQGTRMSKHYVEVDEGVWMAVKGSRERRQVRFARLMESWSEDQQKVAATLGFPSFRWREDYAGDVTEIWSYPAADREFIFDVESGKLAGKRVR
jgi:hypothetical protein